MNPTSFFNEWQTAPLPQAFWDGPAALFSPPHSPWVACFWGTQQTPTGSQHQPHFFLAPFFQTSSTSLFQRWEGEAGSFFSKQALQAHFQREGYSTSEDPLWKGLPPSCVVPSFECFAESFPFSPFSSSSLSKVVPWCFEQWKPVQFGTEAKKKALSHLLGHPPANAAFIYGHWKGNTGFLGATPEILLEHDFKTKQCQTMALAGTAVFPNVLGDKERREQQWVIEDLKAQLDQPQAQRLLSQSYQVGPTEVMHLGALSHFKASVSLLLNKTGEQEWLKLARLLHPTAALGGYPREPSWRWLCEYEQHMPVNRGSFGAPFGFCWPSHRAWIVVGIRRLEWNEEEIRIGAGCGITAESHPKQEWEELASKRAAVLSFFNLSSGPHSTKLE